jgi:hypothetical protein
MRQTLATLTLMFLVAAFALPAQAADASLSLFRAVRISERSVTLSYVSSAPSIGTLAYAESGERSVTLSDAAPQVDHLFTIEDLEPSRAYSFAITDSKAPDTYVILLSPQSVGEPGQSIMPSVQVRDENGKLVSAKLAASSTGSAPNTLPLGIGIVCIAFAFVGWLAYTGRSQKPERTDA